MSQKIAVYAGSFDIPTNGHLKVIEDGAKLFDRLIVATTVNVKKGKGTFTPEERAELLRLVTEHLPNVSVDQFDGQATVRWAKQKGARFLLRGLRNGDDFEKERSIARTNGQLEPSIQTVFVMPPPELAEVSSSLVRELLACQGWEQDVGHFVPEPVWAKLVEKIGGRRRFRDWCRMWRELGCRAPQHKLLDEYGYLVGCYAGQIDRPRAYHNLEHVFTVLGLLDAAAYRMANPWIVRLAAWYHDIVYRVGAKDNELASAQELRRAVEDLTSGGRADYGILAELMIEATVHDGTCPEDLPDAAYLLDADLVSLGLPGDQYEANRRLIREEWSEASDEQYAEGTYDFCVRMLNRKQIYLTDSFRERYEAQARRNLQRTSEMCLAVINHGQEREL